MRESEVADTHAEYTNVDIGAARRTEDGEAVVWMRTPEMRGRMVFDTTAARILARHLIEAADRAEALPEVARP